MPSARLRISTVVERPIYEAIRRLATRDSVGVGEKARMLLMESLESCEDEGLDALVEDRRGKSKRVFSLAEVKRRMTSPAGMEGVRKAR